MLVVCWSDGMKHPIYRQYISFFDLKVSHVYLRDAGDYLTEENVCFIVYGQSCREALLI